MTQNEFSKNKKKHQGFREAFNTKKQEKSAMKKKAQIRSLSLSANVIFTTQLAVI